MAISQAAKSSRWTARWTAALSTEAIIERSRVAVAQAVIAVEDTRVLIEECNILAAMFKARHHAIVVSVPRSP